MRCIASLLLLLVALSGTGVIAQGFDYADALGKSILFYEAQRSGRLPANNRIDWRADSAVDDIVPQGWYDAGDHVKFGFPLGFTITMLAWGGVNYQAGYEAAGQLQWFKECLQWGTDYLIAAHVSKYEFYGQVGDGDVDHTFWGRPEDMTMPRPAFMITSEHGGSELAGESAAALAASSIFYRNIGEGALANEALQHARELFEFADIYRGNYTDSMPSDGYYGSFSGYGDELTWAACWLFKATGEQAYLDMAEGFFESFYQNYPVTWGHSWETKLLGAHVLLYELTGKTAYFNLVEAEVDFYLNQADYTPMGLMYLGDWGSIRGCLNTVLPLMHLADQGYMTNELRTFARSQIDYALGSSGRSYVVGFGVNPPQKPHHRGSSCPDMPESCDGWFDNPGPNPQVLYGALVGGPDINDYYVDDRGDYVKNEVALDYNCGFQSILAGMVQLGLQEK